MIFKIPRYLFFLCRDILHTQPKSEIFVLEKTLHETNAQKFFYIAFVTGLDILVGGFLSRHKK